MPGSDSVHDDDIEFVDRTARAGRVSRGAALEKNVSRNCMTASSRRISPSRAAIDRVRIKSSHPKIERLGYRSSACGMKFKRAFETNRPLRLICVRIGHNI
jgi:hypothetical protein